MTYKPRILVVEDDKYWIDHHRVALKNVDVEIHDAQSVQLAIERVTQQQFAAVIVDLEIPGLRNNALGGFEVIEVTKKLNPYTELLVITGHEEHEVLERVSKQNVDVVTKPVDHRELALSVRGLVNAWSRKLNSVANVLDKFLTSYSVLEKRGHARPAFKLTNEYDLQDLLHSIMKPFYSDVISEEYTLKRAGKTKRLDLVVKGLETVIETKMIRSKAHGIGLSNELDIDIRGYVSHAHCKRLFCYVYDPLHYVRDPRIIERDLSGEAAQDSRVIDVSVFIRPF
jgi:CheY-like chemotaxis protein